MENEIGLRLSEKMLQPAFLPVGLILTASFGCALVAGGRAGWRSTNLSPMRLN